MTPTRRADERLRLEECVREPIRTPGRIQSHGILLAVDRAAGRIVVASSGAERLLGRPLGELGSTALVDAVASGLITDPLRVEHEGTAWEAVLHPLGGLMAVELEPAVTSLEYSRTSVVGAIQRLAAHEDRAALESAAVDEVRAITGFDRVLLYRFHDDAHGEIVAESRVGELEPYLGLHFPASDIPAQARELYLAKLSRAIVSTADPGAELLAADASVAPGGLDLSLAELRAVSPHHLQFMRNMGQASTVSLSLVSRGRLAGMMTLAHRTERRLPVLLRRALEVLATQLQLQFEALDRIEELSRALDVRARRSRLLAPVFAGRDVGATLLDGDETVLDLVGADGVIVRTGGSTRSAGDAPAAGADAVLAHLPAGSLVTAQLAGEHPELAALLPGFAGLIATPLAGDDRLVFLRREVTQTVAWLGDQSAANRATSLSPRSSFSAWKEEVSGRALPWAGVADEVAELGRELTDALERRASARLAELALRDPLTGLRNRRFLLQSLERGSGWDAVLFVDLDEFKAINDGHGHDVGDAVLVEVARRLEEVAGSGDVVARIGGDEFVIVLDGAGAAEAAAERIRAAIGTPIAIDSGELTVTVSVGVAVGGGGDDALDRADAAMYRAKRGGRNRVSL